MDEIDRLRLCVNLDNRKIKEIAAQAKMDPTRLTRTLDKKLRLSSNELVALSKQYDEHKYWIIFGEEEPTIGQISPMTKMAKKNT